MKNKSIRNCMNMIMVVLLVILVSSCKKDNNDNNLPALGSAGPLVMLPTSGDAGTLVTINGSGFSPTASDNTVTFNSKAANVISSTATQLVVQAPEGGTTGTVQVSVGGKSISAGTYTFQTLSIHAIEPVNGPTGTNIRIIGAGFGSNSGPAQVTVNGVSATVISAADTLIVAAVPANSGTGPVAVTVNGQTATGPIFTYQAVTAISPLTGGQGTIVTITGTGFNAVAAQNIVTFNGLTAVVNSVTSTAITATVQKGVTTGPVSVTINGERSVGPVFTVIPPPVISTMSPSSGLAGVQVIITGSNFSSVIAENQVNFNGIAAIISNATTTSLTVNAPANVTTGNVIVTTNNQTTAGPVFTVQSLGISSLSPDNGLDGTVVTLHGTGFSTTPSQNLVYFNGNQAQVTTATATSLVVTVPAGTTTGTVTVKANGLTATGPVFRHAGVSTLIGGPGQTTLNRYMSSIAVDQNGNIFIPDPVNHNIVKITPSGASSIFAGSTTGAQGNQNANGTSALFGVLTGLTVDVNNNVYVSDASNSAIRKITPSGDVSTYLQLSYAPIAIAFDAQGAIYVSQFYNIITRYSTNGSNFVMTTGANTAPFAIDGAGNLYFGGPYDNFLHLANAAGIQSGRFAGSFASGFKDGGPLVGEFNNLGGLAIDPTTQNIIIADQGNNAIRMMTPGGYVTTIAGGSNYTGQAGYQDGGLSAALFNGPNAVAVDKNGVIYVLDAQNLAVRKIATH